MTKPVATLFVAALLAAGLSACGSHGAAPSANSNPSANSHPSVAASRSELTLARDYAKCMRDHGLTNFPDPTVSDGTISYGTDADRSAMKTAPSLSAAQEACKSIQQRISQLPGGKNWKPTAAEMQKLQQFAKCVREHGVPEWPDPDADGHFTVSPKLENENPETRIYPAQRACKQYWDGPVDFHGNKK
jgi:hypothetical protein